jgi:hypothetical protein
VTAHVPGVHVIAMLLDDAVPAQVCGPESETFPSVVTLPENWSKGAPKTSLQSVSVTTAGDPTSDGSQC